MVRAVVSCTALLLVSASSLFGQAEPRPLDSLHVTVGSRLSAELPVATRAIEVLTAEELSRQPVRTVQEALGLALGVDVMARSPAQSDVAIRAGNFEQVLVLIDGMRASNAQTGHLHMDLTIPLEEVDRIEILRGPASALYGADAFGGVINIVTRRHEATAASARIDGGSFGAVGATVGVRAASENTSVGGSVEYRRADGHRAGTDYRVAAGHAAFQTLLAGRPLRATLGVADRDFGAAKFYTSPEAEFDEFEATRVLSARVAWDAPAGERFAVEPRLSVRRHDDRFLLERSDPSFYRNVHRSWQVGGELTARYSPAGAHLAGGVEVYQDRLESTNLGDISEERAAAFAEAGWGQAGDALLSGGVRADWHSSYGTFVAPSVAGALWLGEHRIRASVSRAFRAPNWTERYYEDPANVGDPDIVPEHGWEAELGGEVLAAGARLSLGGFMRETKSLIDWARATGGEPTRWRTMNIGRTTFTGLELAVEDVVLLDTRLAGRASVVSFDVDDMGTFESKYALRPLTRQISLDVERPLIAGASVFLRATHARRAPDDGYLLVDARVSRPFAAGRVFVDVTNLTDEQYLDISALPAPGAALHVGVEWAWRPSGR